MKHPIQPLELAEDGVLRFKENKIIRRLIDDGNIDLNKIASWHASQEDQEQLAQLIGYSLDGYGSLSYVSDESYNIAEKMHKGLDERDAKIAYLEETLKQVRDSLKVMVPAVFKIHPDDLEF